MPKKTLKPGAAYYVGGYRFVKNGEPIRVAAWVKDLSPNARAMMGKGSDAKPNSLEVQAQRHPQTTYLPPEK
jgi:hypothetical protein